MISPILTTATTTLISGIVSAILASLITMSKTKIKKEQKMLEALNKGVRALLWDKLNLIYEMGEFYEGIEVDELHNAENIYNAYHALGGNGTGTKIYEDIKKLPINTKEGKNGLDKIF